MTDGSLKLKETARISRSWTEITSTFVWHHCVTAVCQWTIFSGSYDALRSSVCSMSHPGAPGDGRLKYCPTPAEVSSRRPRNSLVRERLALVCGTVLPEVARKRS